MNHEQPRNDTGSWCTGIGTVMSMGFTHPQGQSCVLFLFQGWTLDSPVKYAFAVMGTFLMCILIEGMNFIRRKHVMRIKAKNKRLIAYFFVYLFQVNLAYMVMLLAMTYSVFIYLAIVFGLTVGHVAMAKPQQEGDPTCCAVPNEEKIVDI